MVKRSFASGVVVFILLFAVLFAPRYVAAVPPQDILIVHSYHLGFPWTDNIMAGMLDVLQKETPGAQIHAEYLDAKRYPPETFGPILTETLIRKTPRLKPKVILVSDDAAFDLMLSLRNELFPGVPLVFCGVNNFKDERLAGQIEVTGVVEDFDIKSTIDVILKLHQQTTYLAVISDSTETGMINLERFRQVAAEFSYRLKYLELFDLSTEELLGKLAKLPPDAIILNLSFFRDRLGQSYSTQDGNNLIAAHAGRAIYSCWDYFLVGDVVGGYVTSGRQQGKAAASMVAAILKGSQAHDIPILRTSPNAYMFDYKVMERFGIKESSLPKGSVVLNHQLSVFEQYWGWFLGIALFCGLQTSLIVASLSRGKKLHVANVALRESEERLDQLAKQSRTFNWEVDSTGLYTFVSHIVKDVLGYQPEELVGKMRFYDLHPEEEREAFKAAAFEVFDRKEPFRDLINAIRCKTGETRWVSTNGIPLLDLDGNLCGYRGSDTVCTERKLAEEALSVERNRLAGVIEGTRTATWEWNVQTGDTVFNERWAEIIGYTLEELTPVSIETWLKFAHPDDLKKCKELLDAHFRGELDYYEFESRMRHKNGKWIWVVDRGKVVSWTDDGKPLIMMGTHQNITERKVAEEVLRESEERFLLAMKASNDGLFDWNLETNEIYYSPAWKRILGYEDHELPNDFSVWENNTDPEDVKKSWELQQKLVSKQIDRFVFEFKMKHKDGHWVDILSRAEAIFSNSGQAIRIVGTHTDITDRKHAEQMLRESETRYRELVENANSIILRMDREGRLTFLNEYAQKFFNYRAEEVLGKSVIGTIVPETESTDRDLRAMIADICRHPDKYATNENENMRQDGSRVWITWTNRILYDESRQVSELLCVGNDITDRKRAEEEKKILSTQLQHAQKLEAIGTLAGGIAHDFNNILGAIVGYSEMIRDDLPINSPSSHDINQVLTASHRAKDLVKQILAFSRQVEDQKISMQPSVIVKEAINLLRSSLPSTITIRQDIDPDAGMVLADPTQIHQIVMNLATNAFHAMEIKGGTLTISLQKKMLSQEDLAAEPDLQPGTFVQLSIRDTGEGITPEIREKIFDPFFTTKEVGKGTGLGLSMVYSIVKSSGGSIVCDSRLGEGTEFRIILPALEGHSVEESEVTTLIPHGKEQILFIDDEEILVDLGQTMLNRLGYHVTARRSSLDALITFQNQPDSFDLVITDQTMPGMTGIDLARRILQIRPEMPIILCTGYSSQISEQKAKAAGIKGFAYKPLAKNDIGALIRKILDEKNS